MVSALPTREAFATATPGEIRDAIRQNLWTDHTVGLAAGYTQANLVILPQEEAFDFLLFCVRNPKPCPLLDVTDAGSPIPDFAAPGADLRTDLPRYRVYEQGVLVEEPTSIEQWWRDDHVGFLLGCSYTFEHALIEAGVRLRHVECGTNVPMFQTTRECRPAGAFHGPLVVSMRPIRADQVERVIEITSRYPKAHGAPVWVGDPGELGIADLSSPDWGEPTPVESGDVPVFWACGVTPQAVVAETKPALVITHAPGHMFISDVRIADLAGVD